MRSESVVPVAGPEPREVIQSSKETNERVTRGELIGLALVLLVGAFLRLYRIGELPPGLHQDEAVYGLHSLTVTLGQFRIYFGEREPLYMYLVAAMTYLVGTGPIALRLTSAIVGSLAVATTWLAARSLFGRLVGLLAAATMATALWPVMISRVGFRAGTLPLVEPLAVYFLWEGWRRQSVVRSLLGGVFLAGTLYTYLAGRFLPIILVVFLLAQLVVGRSFFKGRWRVLFASAGAAALAFAPLGYYFLRHPEAVFGRPAQVSAMSEDVASVASLRELALNGLRTVGMFFVAGDANWRHNLSGTTAFLLPISALLLVGYLVALWRYRRPAHLLLVVWLPLGLLPSALAIDAPHYLRTLAAAPAAAIGAGLGLATVGGWAGRLARITAPSRVNVIPSEARDFGGASGTAPTRALPVNGEGAYRGPSGPSVPYPRPSGRGLPQAGVGAKRPALVTAVLLALALAPGAVSFYDYQVVWASRPETYRSYNIGLAAAGQYLAQSDLWRSGGTVFVTQDFYADRASMTYFLWPYLSNAERLAWSDFGLHAKWFDESRTLPIPASGEAIYVTSERSETASLLAKLGLPGRTVLAGPLSLPAFGAYHLPGPKAIGPETPLAAHGSDGLDLLGYSVVEPAKAGERARLALFWQVSGPAPKSRPSVFCHLLDGSGRALASDDQEIGFAPSDWLPGETIVTWHYLAVPPGLPAGGYSVEAGLYDKATLRRQSLQFADHTDSRALLGPIPVGRGLAARHDVKPQQVLDRSIAPGVKLLGADVSLGSVTPGMRLPLTLYWESDGKSADYAFEVGLRGDSGETGVIRISPAGGLYRPSEWRPAEVVRDDLGFRVGPTVASGDYTLFVRGVSPSGEISESVDLGRVTIAGQPRGFDPPSPKTPLRATFGEANGAGVADLVGFDLSTTEPKPGGKLGLTLYWRAAGETATSYTVFTHLIDGQEQVRGQQDGVPAGGQRPTTGWVEGEYVVDRYELTVAGDAPAGDYRVEIGLYDAATGGRLQVRSGAGPGGDRLVLPPVLRVAR